MGRKSKKPAGKHKRVSPGRPRAAASPAEEKSFWARHRVLLSVASAVTAAITAFLVTLAQNGAAKLVPPSPAAAAPPSAGHAGRPGPGHGHGQAQAHRSSRLGPAVTVTQVPINPGGNMVWMFPGKLILSPAQLSRIDTYLLFGDYIQLNDYLYMLGGYISAAYTSFSFTDNRPHAIWITQIWTIGKSCQAPLTGTLIDAPDGDRNEPGSQLGVNLDGNGLSVMQAPGADVRRWTPDYFRYPVKIGPHATVVFNIRAEASSVACSFRYLASILDNGRPVTLPMGGETFRVSAFAWPYLHAGADRSRHGFPGYQAVYRGGSADPQHDGRLVREYP